MCGSVVLGRRDRITELLIHVCFLIAFKIKIRAYAKSLYRVENHRAIYTKPDDTAGGREDKARRL